MSNGGLKDLLSHAVACRVVLLAALFFGAGSFYGTEIDPVKHFKAIKHFGCAMAAAEEKLGIVERRTDLALMDIKAVKVRICCT